MDDYSDLPREQLLRELRVATTELESFKFACRGDALRLAEAIIENSPAVLFRRTADDPGALVFVSKNVSQWGYLAAELLCGEVLYQDIVHPDDRETIIREIEEHRNNDSEAYVQSYRILTRDGAVRWVHDRTSVVRGENDAPIFRQGIVVDITERVLAEQELRRSEEKFRRIIQTAAEGFILMDDQLLLKDVNRAVLDMLGYEREELIGRSPYEFTPPQQRRFLMAQREKLLNQEQRIFETVMIAKDGSHVPVFVHGNTLTDEQGDFLGNVAFLTNMTEQKKALKLAEEVQRSLQPSRPPQIEGYDIAGRSEPSAEVGGDYFDYIMQPGFTCAELNLVVGDVSGHGVDAALLMTSARAFLRMRATQLGSPAQIVAELNRHLSADLHGSGRFLTMALVRLACTTGELSWILAGHDPPLLYDANHDIFTRLIGRDMPVGVQRDYEFTERTAPPMAGGQLLAIGTDGIWEARSPAGEMFGKARFQEVLRRNAAKTSQEILDAVFHTLRHFTSGAPAEDDVTLVIVKKN